MRFFQQNLSKKPYHLIFCIFSISKELNDSAFDNLDSWVNKELVPKYDKEILSKLLKEKK